MRSFFGFYIAVILSISSVHASSSGPVVDTSSGPVIGRDEGEVSVFRGIPYAAPPIGERRWTLPVAPAAWKEPKDAGAFGPACIQPKNPNPRRDVGEQSEDCLSLNVWAPKDADQAPVMVWIHGGAFRLGASSIPFYDGSKFARSGVVLVSINYRLGAFGFFANEAVREANGSDAANFGLLDQIAALQWVRENIASFGGDPNNVTIFGESAGGASVLYLLTSETAKGLFHKAIAQSGGGLQSALCAWRSCGGRAASRDQSNNTLAGLGVSGESLETLQALSTEQILALSPLSNGMGFGPMIDDDSVTSNIYERIVGGEVASVPFIIGSNSYEASLMRGFRLSPQTVFKSIGGTIDAAKRAYDVKGRKLSDEDFAAELFRDRLFGAPAKIIASAAQEAGLPVRRYYFDYVLKRREGKAKGARHGAEIFYVFDNLGILPGARFIVGREDEKMATRMHELWTSFASSGVPKAEGVDWPRADNAGNPILVVSPKGFETHETFQEDQMSYQAELFKASREKLNNTAGE